MTENPESKIKYLILYGLIKSDSTFFDDIENVDEKIALRKKIIKIEIYTGKKKIEQNEKECISGIKLTYRDLYNGKTEEIVHKGTQNFEDVKEFKINPGEYLSDFYIRFTNECEYISQIGFKTSKGRDFFAGTEEGENKVVDINDKQNIIIGFYGRLGTHLDAIGIIYTSQKEYFFESLFYVLAIRFLIKKKKEFKEKWEKNYNELEKEYKYLWKTLLLPDPSFACILKYISPY